MRYVGHQCILTLACNCSKGSVSALPALRRFCSIQLPQIIKPMRCGPRVVRHMLRIPVTEVILDEAQGDMRGIW